MSHLLRSFIRTAYPPFGSSRSIHTRHSVRKLHTNKRQTPKPQILERVPTNPRSCIRVRSTYTRMVSILINSLSPYSIISITSTPPFLNLPFSKAPHSHPISSLTTAPSQLQPSIPLPPFLKLSPLQPPQKQMSAMQCAHRTKHSRCSRNGTSQRTRGRFRYSWTRRSGTLPPLLTVSPCFLSSSLPCCPIVVFIPCIARAKSHARKCSVGVVYVCCTSSERRETNS